jgi:hypothetical protein
MVVHFRNMGDRIIICSWNFRFANNELFVWHVCFSLVVVPAPSLFLHSAFILNSFGDCHTKKKLTPRESGTTKTRSGRHRMWSTQSTASTCSLQRRRIRMSESINPSISSSQQRNCTLLSDDLRSIFRNETHVTFASQSCLLWDDNGRLVDCAGCL